MYQHKPLALAVTLTILFYCNGARSVEAGLITSDRKQLVVGPYDSSVVNYNLKRSVANSSIWIPPFIGLARNGFTCASEWTSRVITFLLRFSKMGLEVKTYDG